MKNIIYFVYDYYYFFKLGGVKLSYVANYCEYSFL